MVRENERLRGTEYIGRGLPMKAELRQGESVAIHSHDYFELEILLEGTGTMVLNDREYRLAPGSIYLLTPADFHAVRFDGANRLWNISFDQSVPAEYWPAVLFSGLYRLAEPAVLLRLDAAAALLAQEPDSGCGRLLLEYLLKTAGFWADGAAALSPIRRAMLYVQTYFRDDPSLSQTAAHVGLSPSYFGSLFRQETGETYISYLNRRKVSCAAMLLRRGRSVTEACFEAGFGSLSGFRYIFRQITGKSPSEYKEPLPF